MKLPSLFRTLCATEKQARYLSLHALVTRIIWLCVLLLMVLPATLVGILGGRYAGRILAGSVAALTESPSQTPPGPVIAEIEAVHRMLVDTAAFREMAEAQHRDKDGSSGNIGSRNCP